MDIAPTYGVGDRGTERLQLHTVVVLPADGTKVLNHATNLGTIAAPRRTGRLETEKPAAKLGVAAANWPWRCAASTEEKAQGLPQWKKLVGVLVDAGPEW